MQKREKLIIELEDLQGTRRNSVGLRQVQEEIQQIEESLFTLRTEREEKAADAAKAGENMDAVIGEYEKQITNKKKRLGVLTVKRKALQSAIAEKQEELARWELKKLQEYETTLPARHLKLIKLRDEKKREYEEAEKQVQSVQFLKLDTRRKIDNIKKELRSQEPVLSPEEKEEKRLRIDYTLRCKTMFAEMDGAIYRMLQHMDNPVKRLQRLKELRYAEGRMMYDFDFPWPPQRPPERPNPFQGFSDEQICSLEFQDAVTLRDGEESEKEKIRKKYIGKTVVTEEDRELRKLRPAPLVQRPD